MKVLVTGGAGYIGSVTATALEDAGHTPVVLDSLLSGLRAFAERHAFYEGEVGDRELVRRIFADHPDIECTIHMAARTIVPESVSKPADYYRANVSQTLELAEELHDLGRPRLVFSSSASVYARTDDFEVDESSALAPTSPYARTKMVAELMLRDLADAGALRAVALRYFNPIGSDPGLRTGTYLPVPTHVVGQLVRVARGVQPEFRLTGTDLPTRDGTGIRDYVHVWDVARAHVAVVERFDEVCPVGTRDFDVLNIGTGQGVTVRELVEAVERAAGVAIRVVEAPSRPGDAIGAFANVGRAREVLGWSAEHTLDEAIRSALAWADRRDEVLG